VQYVGYSITVAGMFVYKDFKKDPVALQSWINLHLLRHLTALSPALSLSPSAKVKYSGGALSDAVGAGAAHTHTHGDHESVPPYDPSPAHGSLQQRATRRDASHVESIRGTHSINHQGEGVHVRPSSLSGRDMTTASSGSSSGGGSDDDECGSSELDEYGQDYAARGKEHLLPVHTAPSAQAQAQSASAGWGWSAASMMEMVGMGSSGGGGVMKEGDVTTALLSVK
jgi:hypothetical protein